MVFISRRNSRNKEKAEVSKYNPVPRYRAYGVTRKEYEWVERLNQFLLNVAAILALAGPTIYIVGALVAVFLFGSVLAKVILWLSIAIVLIPLLTSKSLNRLRLNIKLKRLCKKQKYELCFKRNFRESLTWSPDKYDFTIETPIRVYYVHVLLIANRRQKILFDSAEEIIVTTPPPKNSYTMVFGTKPKIKSLKLDLSDIPTSCLKEVVPIILVLPACEDMSYKRSNVTIIPTGNGAEHFGFTLFNAKAFFRFLPRFEQNAQSK